jgi:hypothetical protein
LTGIWLASYVALWVLVAILATAVFALYHYFGQLYLNSEQGRTGQGPEVVKLPDLIITAADGVRWTVPDGREALIAFVDVECELCAELLPDLAAFAVERPSVLTVALVGGDEASVDEFGAPLRGIAIVVPDARSRHAVRAGVSAYPFVVAVDKDGVVVGKTLANDRRDLERVATSLRRAPRRPRVEEEVAV